MMAQTRQRSDTLQPQQQLLLEEPKKQVSSSGSSNIGSNYEGSSMYISKKSKIPTSNPTQMVLQSLEDTTKEEMLRDAILIPYYKPGYVLLYGPDQFFYQSKLFATVYERLVKAR